MELSLQELSNSSNSSFQEQLYQQKLVCTLKQILILWIRKMFPPKNNIKIKVINNNEVYLQGKQSQIQDYKIYLSKNLESFKIQIIRFKKQIIIQKIQYQLNNLDQTKIIRPNAIKLATEQIINKFQIVQIQNITKALFSQGQNFILVSFLKIKEKQIMDIISKIMNQQNNNMSTSSSKSYKNNYKQENNQDNDKKQNIIQQVIQKQQQKQKIQAREQSRPRSIRKKKLLYTQKVKLKYFKIQEMKKWVRAKKMLMSDLQYQRLDDNQMVVNFTNCSNEDQQVKTKNIKYYMNHIKFIHLTELHLKVIQDIVQFYDPEMNAQIQLFQGQIPYDSNQKKIVELYYNSKIYQGRSNLRKFIGFIIKGIKPQVQAIQTQIKQKLHRINLSNCQQQIKIFIKDLQNQINDIKVQKLIQRVLEKQLKSQQLIKSYIIKYTNRDIIITANINLQNRNKLKDYQEQLTKKINLNIKVKEIKKNLIKQEITNIINQYKDQHIIIQYPQCFKLIQQNNKKNTIIDQLIDRINQVKQNYQIKEKKIKIDSKKIQLVKKFVCNIKIKNQQLSNIKEFFTNQQGKSQITLFGPSNFLTYMQIQIKKFLQQLKENTKSYNFQITQQESQSLVGSQQIIKTIMKKFNIQIIVKQINVNLLIDVGQFIKIKVIKGVNYKLQGLTSGMIFFFKSKEQINRSKNSFLKQLKLIIKNQKSNAFVQYKDQQKNYTFAYYQQFKLKDIILMSNKYQQYGEYKLSFFMPSKLKDKKQCIKNIIKQTIELVKEKKKKFIFTLLQHKQDEDLQQIVENNNHYRVLLNAKFSEINLKYHQQQQQYLNIIINSIKNQLKNNIITHEMKINHNYDVQTIKQISQTAKQLKLKIQFSKNKDSIKIISQDQNNLIKFIRIVQKICSTFNNPTIVYPKYWQMKQSQQIQLFNVDKNSEQFIKIQNQFKISKIKKLERIQNLIIYKKYFEEKLFLKQLNGGKQIKQMMLYHGTSNTDPSIIYNDKQQAFNVNYSGDKNFLGYGVYFAQQSAYSNNRYYYFDKVNNYKQLFYCLVLVGDSQKIINIMIDGKILMKDVIDTNYKDTVKKIRYESMTAFLQKSNVFVVYKNRRAYPLYLISY